MTGGYLRTNFTRSGNATLTAIGGGYALTSYAGGAGLYQPFGGFIMGSITMSGASVASITAAEAMSAWFGSSIYGAGYKIKVISIMTRIGPIAAPTGMIASNSGSILIFLPVNSAALGLGSSVSAVFEWAGFITSAP